MIVDTVLFLLTEVERLLDHISINIDTIHYKREAEVLLDHILIIIDTVLSDRGREVIRPYIDYN